jgi:hypothetical protein
LNYGAKVAMKVARAEWGKVPIPGEKGAITEPILGTLSYDVHNITLAPNPILPDPTITLVPSVGFLLHVCVNRLRSFSSFFSLFFLFCRFKKVVIIIKITYNNCDILLLFLSDLCWVGSQQSQLGSLVWPVGAV